MPVFFHRLENALKRANEFIDVGKKTRALEILCDVLRSRKHRNWQKNHEDIMMKYLELCVELRKSYIAKEGIYQYKIICQQAYIKSFEDVMRQYLALAEEKAEAARQESHIVVDVDDLDMVQTPESLLLSAVSSEDSQDRTDRVVLLPWVKFLWESYRQCLDLLKNNSRTERLYHDVAHLAFKFCIKYNRKTEFRKLCDNLHAHLDILKKQQTQQPLHNQQNAINLSNPDTLAMHLETRLVQLESAIQMELWQEAYKATDDIKRFGLMNLAKKPPKPQLMANYYQKLALVFWKANCHLFHSAALFRLFNLTKELKKNITQEDVQKMASKLVLATLSVPIPPSRADIDKLVDTEENVVENHQRNLASLIGLSTNIPTRMSLIKDLKRMGVLQYSYQPLQDLYRYLEVDFHPLVLCGRVSTVIEFINTNEELRQYVPALKDVAIIRLLKEISQVYESIESRRLLQLCPFADSIYLEYMIVNAARRNDLQVRIDHRRGCLFFGKEMRVSHGEEKIEGPHLQSMPNEQIRLQLMNMYSALVKSKHMIEPEKAKTQRDELKLKIVDMYYKTAEEDHKRVLQRQSAIELRKEQLEQIGIRKEEEERKIFEEKQSQMRAAEEERMQKEHDERNRQKMLRQEMEVKKRMAMAQIERLKVSDSKKTGLEGLDDEELAKLGPDEIKSRQFEQLEKERREQLLKQKKLERKIDHLERAKRQEEVELQLQFYENWKQEEEKSWNAMEEERITELVTDRQLALKHRARLERMMDDKNEFSLQITKARTDDYEEKLDRWKSILDEERGQRLLLRKKKRKEERQAKYLEDIKVEKERRKAEIQRKKMEEEKAKNMEERKQLDDKAAKQRQREKEVEEKQKMREMEGHKTKDETEMSRDDDAGDDKTARVRPEVEQNWRSTKSEEGPWRRGGPTPAAASSTAYQPPRPRELPERVRDLPERVRDLPERSLQDRSRDLPERKRDNEGAWRMDDRENRGPLPRRDNDGGMRRDMDDRSDMRRRDFGGRDGDRRDVDRRDIDRNEPRRRDDDRGGDDRRGFNRDPDRRPPPPSRSEDADNWRRGGAGGGGGQAGGGGGQTGDGGSWRSKRPQQEQRRPEPRDIRSGKGFNDHSRKEDGDEDDGQGKWTTVLRSK